MRPPEWRQRVLLCAADKEVIDTISTAFGAETELVVVPNSAETLLKLESAPFHVLIIDTSASDPKLHYFEEKENISFIELVQSGVQLNQGLTVVLLANKMLLKDGRFARKSGASLIMDRKSISLSRLVYVIRVLRKRTFRTLLLRDLKPGDSLSADLYHFLPANNRYSIFLPSQSPLTPEKYEKLHQTGAHHLYVLEAGFEDVLKALVKARGERSFSDRLAAIRNGYQNVLRRLFDISTDGNLIEGKVTAAAAMEVVQQLDELTALYPDPISCIRELPFPRWSAIAHGINCAIFALLFARQCRMRDSQELAWAALLHNVGLAEVDQKTATKGEASLNAEELKEYQRHVEHGINLLKQKMVPLTPLMEEAILHHHECYDGSGFPHALAGNLLSEAAGLLAIVGAYDHLLALRPGELALTPAGAWAELRRLHEISTSFQKKFHPGLLQKIDPLFASA